MSNLVVVAVWDSAIQAFGRPVFVPAVGAALRSFMDEVNRAEKGNELHDHASDFELVHLAFFDENTGVFSPVERVVLLRGKDVRHDAP